MMVAGETFELTPEIGSRGQNRDDGKVLQVVSPIASTVILFSDEDSDLEILLVTSHFRSAYYSFTNLVKTRVSEVTGIPVEAIQYFSSHNHSDVALTPGTYPAGAPSFDDRASEQDLTGAGREFLDRLCASARNLRPGLRPARVRWALGHEKRISYNRKGRRADGSTYFMREEDRVLLEPDFSGEIDDDAPVVGFFDPDEFPICFLVQFAAHPCTVYHPQHPVVFGEYPQVAGQVLSKAFGGVPVGFLQGCCGDLSAKGFMSDRPLSEKIDEAIDYGTKLGNTWVEAARTLTDSSTDGIGLKVHRTRRRKPRYGLNCAM
jgi:hypothetical protein